MIFSEILSCWINTLSPQLDLSSLNSKIITFEMSDGSFSKSFYVHNQRIETTDIPHRTADLIISGDLYTLWQFMGGNDRAAVTIEGELKLAVELQKIIQNSQIDWNEWLQRLTGDAPQQIFNSIKNPFSSQTESMMERIRDLEQRLSELESEVRKK